MECNNTKTSASCSRTIVTAVRKVGIPYSTNTDIQIVDELRPTTQSNTQSVYFVIQSIIALKFLCISLDVCGKIPANMVNESDIKFFEEKEREKEREKEQEGKDAVNSGHYILPATPRGSTHTLCGQIVLPCTIFQHFYKCSHH